MAGSAGAIRAGRAFVELFADAGPLQKGLASAAASLRAWGDGVAAIGQRITLAGTAALGAFVLAAKLFAQFGDQMGGKDAENAERLRAAFQQLKANLLGLGVTIGSAIAPLLTELMGKITQVVKDVTDWINANRPLVVMLLKLAAGVTAFGLALTLVGKLMTAFSVVTTVGLAIVKVGFLALTAVFAVVKIAAILMWAAVSGPIGLVALALAAMAAGGVAAFALLSKEGQEAGQTIARSWGDIKEAAVTAWGGIVDAVKSGDLGLAAKIAWQGLKTVWAQGVAFIHTAWVEFTSWFGDRWRSVVSAFSMAINDAWSGVRSAWTETTAFLSQAWQSFIGTIKQMWLSFTGFFKKAWTKIKGLFKSDDEARAEIDRVNREVEAEKEAAAQVTGDQKAAIEAERRAKRQAIAEQHGAIEKELIAQRNREQAEADQAKRDKLAAIAAEAAEARDELNKLAALAKQKAAAMEEKVKNRADFRKGSGEVSGTFSAAAASRMGGETIEQRQLQEQREANARLQRLIDLQQQIRRAIEQGGIVLR